MNKCFCGQDKRFTHVCANGSVLPAQQPDPIHLALNNRCVSCNQLRADLEAALREKQRLENEIAACCRELEEARGTEGE